jgi:S-disulfanyl-L-cysteine oxidoreductase SoxD
LALPGVNPVCRLGPDQYVCRARHSGLGRGATAGEVAAWDIDVRPDFKGLPAGAGSVVKGH